MSLYLASNVDFLPHPTVQNWKDSCEKELDLGDFPWTQTFNARFSGKKVCCSKAYSEQEPFCVLQLLACLAFFTSGMNPTAFVSLAERFPGHAFKDPSCPFRTSDTTNGFLQPELDDFMLDAVMPGTGRSPQMEPFASLSRGSSGGLWEQLVTSSSWHAQGKQSSTCKALKVPRWAHGCARFHYNLSSFPHSAASQIFAPKVPNLLLMLL